MVFINLCFLSISFDRQGLLSVSSCLLCLSFHANDRPWRVSCQCPNVHLLFRFRLMIVLDAFGGQHFDTCQNDLFHLFILGLSCCWQMLCENTSVQLNTFHVVVQFRMNTSCVPQWSKIYDRQCNRISLHENQICGTRVVYSFMTTSKQNWMSQMEKTLHMECKDVTNRLGSRATVNS